MPAIVWNEDLPSQSSSASLSDDEFRSMMSNMATGLGESLYWPGSAATDGGHSGASVGEMRPGSARAGTPTSLGTGGNPDGFLQLPIDTNALAHIGSTWTGQLSHSAMLEHNDGIGNAPFTEHWLLQMGTSQSTDSVGVTFPSVYSGVPHVTIARGQGGRDFDIAIRGLTASGFTLDTSHVAGGAVPTGTFLWFSEGTIRIA